MDDPPTPDPVRWWLGLNVGKHDHHATLHDPTGRPVRSQTRGHDGEEPPTQECRPPAAAGAPTPRRK